MINLLKYIKNRNKVKQYHYACLKTLGNRNSVAAFGRFWENNGDDLMTLVAGKLVEYSQNNTYTPEEYLAYRTGINEISKFFLDACAELKVYEKENK